MNVDKTPFVPIDQFQTASLRDCEDGYFQTAEAGQRRDIVVISNAESRGGVVMTATDGPIYVEFDARNPARGHGVLWPAPSIQVDRTTMYRVNTTNEQAGDIVLMDGRVHIVALSNDGWKDTYRQPLWAAANTKGEEPIGFRAWRFVAGPAEAINTVFEWRAVETVKDD